MDQQKQNKRNAPAYSLTYEEAVLVGYIIERAMVTLEYDKEDKEYRSNDDFVASAGW